MKQEIYSGFLFACEEANALISSTYSKAVVSYSSMDNETKAQSDSVSLWILCDILYIVFDINQTSFHLYSLRPEAASTREEWYGKTCSWCFLPSLFTVLVTDSLMIDLQGKSSETGDSHPKQNKKIFKIIWVFFLTVSNMIV